METLPSPLPGGNQSRGPVIFAITLTLYIFVVLSSALRLFTRAWLVRQLGWDDFSSGLALILSACSTAFVFRQLRDGGGRHVYYLKISQIIEIRKYVTLAQLFLIIITCLTKVSIIFFLMRIPNSKRLILSLKLLIVALLIVNGTCSIVLIAQCRPMAGLWDPFVEAHCWSARVYLVWGYFQGAFSAVTDLICTALPIVVLWRVRISTRNKLAIWAVMSVGLLATACSIVRTTLFAAILDEIDPTWSINDVETWAILEQNFGLIAVNFPAMLPLFHFLAEKISSQQCSVKSYFQRKSYALNGIELSVVGEPRLQRGFQRMDDRIEPIGDGAQHV